MLWCGLLLFIPMRESEPSFGSRVETRESFRIRNPDRLLTDLEAIDTLFDIDSLVAKINAKIDQKIALERDDGTNDWAEWKRLGIFIAHERRFSPDVARVLQQNGVDIYPDETVLELHIPPQKVEGNDRLKSLVRIYDYLKANEPNRRLPRFIYGISYLAESAKKYGFEVLDLPDRIKSMSGPATLLRQWADSKDERKRRMAQFFKESDIKLAYLSVDDFLRIVESRPDFRKLGVEVLIDCLRMRDPLRVPLENR